MTGAMLTLMAAAAAAAAAAATPGQNARPAGVPQSWITDEDYPAAALRAGQRGTSAVRLTIDARGAVTGCTITGSSGSPILDARACSVLQERAHFFPATNARGRPVAGTWSARFTWKLPDDSTPSQPLGYLLMTASLAPDASLISCATTTVDGAPAVLDLCGRVMAGGVPVWLRSRAAAFGILRLRTGYSFDAGPAEPNPQWGRLLLKHEVEMSLSEEGHFAACKSVASVGEDTLPDPCASYQRFVVAGPGGGAPALHHMILELSLYGVPRARADGAGRKGSQ